jgi:hypothetical protein
MPSSFYDGVNKKAPLALYWVKSRSDTWLAFETFNLDGVGAVAGVYIIWHAGNPGRVVYVGQASDIASRLSVHRANAEICGHRAKGTLYVTWAAVAAVDRDGVERYLADMWNPLVGDAHPAVTPIAVNSPW